MADQLNRSELLKLARLGAPARIEELRKEIKAIEKLVGGGSQEQTKSVSTPRKRRRKLSAAGRAAISAAQKKRWAAIKAKKKAK